MNLLQVVVGTLLLLFGIRWLRKAMLRSAGVIDLRDEGALYARENTLKFAVGVMVSAFGIFWFGEGIGMHWPMGDLTLLALMVGLLGASALGVRVARG